MYTVKQDTIALITLPGGKITEQKYNTGHMIKGKVSFAGLNLTGFEFEGYTAVFFSGHIFKTRVKVQE